MKSWCPLIALPLVLAGCAGPAHDAPEPLPRHQGEAFTTTMDCGRMTIEVHGDGDGVTVFAAGEEYRMEPAISASGAKYQVAGDQATTFWSKGNNAWLELNGQPWPECVTPGALPLPFKAQGNEPFWNLQLEVGQLTLQRLGDDQPLVKPYAVTATNPATRTLTASTPQGDLQLAVTTGLCRDSMSGMPYPGEVVVTLGEDSLTGCGGSPERLLQGAEWVVEDIASGGIIDRSRVTLDFYTDGRVAGRGSCNRYNGQYRLSGEGLAISEVASTRMACAPALMTQEQRFLALLDGVQRFDFDDTGALLLITADEVVLKARLE